MKFYPFMPPLNRPVGRFLGDEFLSLTKVSGLPRLAFVFQHPVP